MSLLLPVELNVIAVAVNAVDVNILLLPVAENAAAPNG